jgi:hypothetical protein
MDEMRSTSGEGHPAGGDALRNEHRLWRGGFAYWAVWTAGCLAFPIAGLAGLAAAGGRVDGPVAALAGGAVTGLVIGAGQALAARGRLPLVRWTLATGAGMGVGLLAGAAIAGYRTGLGQLALQGAVTGVFVGLAQAVSLPSTAGRWRWAWAAAAPPLWALGWTVTTLAGIDVNSSFTIFGLSGALVYSALSGVVLHTLHLPARRFRDLLP